MALTARTVILMRDKGETCFCCAKFRYQIGTTLTETIRHAIEKLETDKLLKSCRTFTRSRFVALQRCPSDFYDHGGVNRLVAGSNPARGATLTFSL
jgi:hypothetical protein